MYGKPSPETTLNYFNDLVVNLAEGPCSDFMTFDPKKFITLPWVTKKCLLAYHKLMNALKYFRQNTKISIWTQNYQNRCERMKAHALNFKCCYILKTALIFESFLISCKLIHVFYRYCNTLMYDQKQPRLIYIKKLFQN